MIAPKKRKLITILMIIILVIIGGVVYINSSYGKEKIALMINKYFMTISETDEYKDSFEEISYRNYKILYNKSAEQSLNMIFAYLDKLEKESENIFGFMLTEELTIQLDYDKDVYNERHSIGSYIRDSAGFYNTTMQTIYMNVEDAYTEIIRNLPKVKELNDGSFMINSFSFRETLFNYYSRYIYNSFIKENKISAEALPLWFQEGIVEYMALSTSYSEEKLEFIPLKELVSENQWLEINNSSTNINPYIQSNYIIHKMVSLNSESVLKNIILNCNDKRFNESFEEIMEISLEEFENIVKSDFNNYTNMNYVHNNSGESEYNEIKIKCLEDYIKANEDDIRAYEALCTFYENSRGFDEVISFLKESIEKHPAESILWRRLAIVYENNNIMDLAKECFDKEAELSGD